MALGIHKPSKQQVQDWIDARSLKDEFTALHLASYRGNMDAIRTLVSNGADQHAENYFGLNMIHVAA
jgi:ankyrin repeat protein